MQDEANDPDGGMIPLHEDQLTVMRIRTSIYTAVLALAALVAGLAFLVETPVLSLGPAGGLALLGAFSALVLAPRRYRAWGYHEGEDELAIRRGLWVRTRTIVPFGRVQHIDLSQGPIERPFGLATLILHTAGTRGATVALPGLEQEQAERMRDRIRAKIRQDLL
jgi:membrane protein YdbS with pleckstrin-like domain